MGSCISKCRPKKHEADDYFHVPVNVQDKGVIAQAPTISSTPKLQPSRISPCSQSPTHSASSTSSFNISSSSNVSTASSLSSSSSSALSLKERSFSNEFLWSRAKENPHIVQVNSIKASPVNHLATSSCKAQVVKVDSPARESRKRAAGTQLVKHDSAQRVSPTRSRTTLQKRPSPISRSPSPLTRQKSFRCDSDQRLNSACPLPCRTTLRPPSPSRRFNGDSSREVLSSSRSRVNGSRTTSASFMQQQSVSKKERLRPPCPNNIRENLRAVSPTNTAISQVGFSHLNAQSRIHRVGSKIDGVAVEEALSYKDVNSLPLEDMINPHIALDCFIFL